MELKETFQKVKAASKTLGLLTDEQRNEILQAVEMCIRDRKGGNLSKETFDYIYQQFEGHTWYIQCIMNRLYETEIQDVYKRQQLHRSAKQVYPKKRSETAKTQKATIHDFLKLFCQLEALLGVCHGRVVTVGIIPVSYTHLDVYKRQLPVPRRALLSGRQGLQH